MIKLGYNFSIFPIMIKKALILCAVSAVKINKAPSNSRLIQTSNEIMTVLNQYETETMANLLDNAGHFHLNFMSSLA